jgi:hypothetical protein
MFIKYSKSSHMKKIYLFVTLFLLIVLVSQAQSPINCDFWVTAKTCINNEVSVGDSGNPENAVFHWNFDGAVVLSGTGPGPYWVKWSTPGEKHIVLTITFEGQTCTATRPVVVIEQPSLFHMMGGGTLVQGSPGINIGLSGSQTGINYILRHNNLNTGISVPGTGQAISFGLQTALGEYTAYARVAGSDCMREMEGVAVINSGLQPFICMVTFDTALSKNKIIWNKYSGHHHAYFNIYKETYQNNEFSKIAEVPFANMSVYVDPTSDPLIKSDKFKISVTDSSGYEGEKSPFHKTIHLNINPGISGFNLIWNHYEGFDFQTYRIHRKHATGSWETIDSVASNVDSYTDFYSESGVTTYFIEVVRLEPCNPSLKSGEILSVISNTVAAAPLGIGENERIPVLIYPNPVSDKLNLVIPGHAVYQVEILRLDGVITGTSLITGPTAEINVSDLVNGLYLLRITGNNAVTVRKFVKN